MLGTMIDITTQKESQLTLLESEKRYRNLVQELEQRVKQRTQALSEAN